MNSPLLFDKLMKEVPVEFRDSLHDLYRATYKDGYESGRMDQVDKCACNSDVTDNDEFPEEPDDDL